MAGSSLGITVCALLLALSTIVLTVTQMEPINQLTDTWNVDQPPADRTVLRQRWLSLHAVRTVTLAFAVLLGAQLVDRRQVVTVNIVGTAAPAVQSGRLTDVEV